MKIYDDFLSFLLRDVLFVSQAISKRMVPHLLCSDVPFNAHMELYTFILRYYRKYKEALPKEALSRVLSATENMLDPQKQEIVFLYDSIKLNKSDLAFDFICDEIKSNFKIHHLRNTLIDVSDKLQRGEISNVVPSLKYTVSYIETSLEDSIKEGTIQSSVEIRSEKYNMAKNNHEITRGIGVGFPTIDSSTHGIQPGEMMLVAAASGDGKSVFLLNAAHYVQTKLGKNVLFFSLENPKEQLERRYESLDSGIDYLKLKCATLTLEEEKRYNESLERQKTYAGSFHTVDMPDGNCNANIVSAKISELSATMKIDLVVIDYLGLMVLNSEASAKKLARDEYYGNIAKEVRGIARMNKLPVLSAIQINREGIKSNDYNLSHIALSQQIVNHSDIIMAFKPTNDEAVMAGGIVPLKAKLLKHRDGPTRNFDLSCNFACMRMSEVGS